ncbi:glucose-1-phosphate thymidylyltransferase [bacterium]|nr:glucose-1-phosphate thymidylyltransferase [bacterium]
MSDDLKAVVLCAGEGTRLRPLTFSKPKHLLPVAGKPLLGHVLDALAAAGVHEVGLVVGYLAEAVQGYVGDGEQWGVTATYIRQEHPLGLGHAIKQAEGFLDGAPFLVYLGDNLLGDGITSFVDDFRAGNGDAALLLKEVPDPRRYGVAVVDEQRRVTRVVEKPAQPPSNLAIVGVYAFQPIIFDAIDSIKPSPRGELEITDAIQHLIEQDRVVKAGLVAGFWEDAGEPAALLVANRFYLDRTVTETRVPLRNGCTLSGPASVGPGTRITNSRLEGPCLIGSNCHVDNCVIGPYAAIGDGCDIKDSRVEDSIIQQKCQITGVALQHSVLGERVQIGGGETPERPLHMVLGDMAQIRML